MVTAAPISVVVVAWNAGSSLASCIESLRESARNASATIEIVLVDNASSDGAVDDLEVGAVDIVVRNPLNAGYGVAAAQGLALASAPWVLLVNPDVVVDRRFVAALITGVKRARARVATLVPELRYASRPAVINCRGITVDEIGVPAEIDAGVPADRRPLPSHPPLGGSSGCCLLRADHVRRLGGPEPAFFAYLEDVDLALRLARAGYEAVFVPDAIAFHEGSASAGARSPLKAYLVGRNRRLLFSLHGPRTLRARAWRLLTETGHALVTSLTSPVAPWLGRAEALRLRSYVAFLRRARAAYEPARTAPPLATRATLRGTLARKRAVTSVHEREEKPDVERRGSV
jgi:GT2 family glycosyltransferase